MAAGPEYSHRFTFLEGCYRKNVDTFSSLDMEGPESPEGMKHINAAKPPRHISGMRHCSSSLHLVATPELELERGGISLNTTKQVKEGFSPVFRSGSCAEIGPRAYMEDEHICIDKLLDHIHIMTDFALPSAFYGVFDGHGGTDAVSFIRRNLLQFIVEDNHFPASLEKAIKSAFVKADYALADSHSLDRSSGTTALTALIFGNKMHIANVGDCRAVLSKRGKAIVLSRDHKADCVIEKHRIEKLGGKVFDGYLNGQLSVARALGDWHMKGPKGSSCPLSGEPEMREMVLTKEDEFLIVACDGLWDVMTSQWAVSRVRKELMLHNDPERCCKELVLEALRRDTRDNLTVIIVCFSSEPPPRIEMPTSRFGRSISAEGLNRLKGLMDDGDV